MRRKPSSFTLPALTPESAYLSRRDLLRAMGFAGLGLAGLLGSPALWAGEVRDVAGTLVNLHALKAAPNPSFPPGGAAAAPLGLLTDRIQAASFNNFYEFTTGKEVWPLVEGFVTRPWQVEVVGLVERPLTLDAQQLARDMPLEERHLRFRCVETWAMDLPWIGFPLGLILEQARPLPAARYAAFRSFLRRDQAPGQARQGRLFDLWPYLEALTLPEALSELAFVAVGVYGHELPRQQGAPLRLVLPWKYGYKGIKAFTRIELTADRPPTFWNTLAPGEYDFWSNIDPAVPHPRWSQAEEYMLDTGATRPTLKYGGYGQYVAHLYAGLSPDDPGYGFGG